jgi:hypothetical protein
MNTSEMRALTAQIDRLLEAVKPGTKLPAERTNPSNFIDTLTTVVDIVVPKSDDEPDQKDVTQLPLVNDPRNVELSAHLRGMPGGRRPISRVKPPSRTDIEAAKKEMIGRLPGGGRK